MEYCVYKFNFIAPIHIGEEKLEASNYTIMADTFFSALCIEAIRGFGEEKLNELLDYVKKEQLRFSDLLPFTGDELFFPKPLLKIQKESNGDSTEKKLYKKLKYITISNMNKYISGGLNPTDETNKLKNLGVLSTRTLSSSLDEEKMQTNERLPYNMQVYSFNENCGLYLIMAAKDNEIIKIVEGLLKCLSYSGIGGKKSSGFGRFEVEKIKTPAILKEKINFDKGGVLLSCAMAKGDELELSLENAAYLLKRRAGFSASKELYRKKDFYSFAAGSYFCCAFSGDVFDVATKHSHPIYRYAKPMFYEV